MRKVTIEMKKKSKIIIWFLIVLVVIGIDQAVKYWSEEILQYTGFRPQIFGLVGFTYQQNHGMAFSLFDGPGMNTFFTVFISVAILAIGYLAFSSKFQELRFFWPSTLIIGGALGNLIDRIFRGYVVDMIQTLFINFPVFNVADSCIVIGGIGYIIYLLIVTFRQKKKKTR